MQSPPVRRRAEEVHDHQTDFDVLPETASLTFRRVRVAIRASSRVQKQLSTGSRIYRNRKEDVAKCAEGARSPQTSAKIKPQMSMSTLSNPQAKREDAPSRLRDSPGGDSIKAFRATAGGGQHLVRASTDECLREVSPANGLGGVEPEVRPDVDVVLVRGTRPDAECDSGESPRRRDRKDQEGVPGLAGGFADVGWSTLIATGRTQPPRNPASRFSTPRNSRLQKGHQ